MRQRVVEAALAAPDQSPRELAWQLTDREDHFLSESSVYRILKAVDLIPSPAYIVLSAATTVRHPTHRPNELWQTDFTYLQVVGWGWYYLSTVLDDDSRYIMAWALRTSMQTADVTETLDLVRATTGVDRIRVVHRPRLLSDNGPGYVSAELERHGLGHTRGAPYHPMTQGNIERYHRSMKNVVKLEKHYSPWALERAIARFVDAYNHRHLHEALDNVTSAEVYEGCVRRFWLDPTRSNGGHWHSGHGRIYTDTDRATGEESLLNLRSNCPDWFDDIQSADPEEIQDDLVDGGEALKLGSRLEASHLPLAQPRRLVGDLRTVVGILLRTVTDGITVRRAAG